MLMRWHVLNGLRSSRQAVRRKAPTRGITPVLEIVEARALLSTLTVTSTADSGPGSLRAVIGTAADGDTVTFALDGRNSTITLNSPIVVNDLSLNIQGPGSNRLTISGNKTSSVFFFNNTLRAPSKQATVSGVTIADGYSPFGFGGIGVSGMSLTIDHSVLSGNQGAFAGAVGFVGLGPLGIQNTLTITDTTLVGNQGQTGGGITVFGGPAVISHSVLTGNRSDQGGAISYSGRGDSFSTLVITASSLSGNSVGSADASIAAGGAVFIENAGLTVSDSTFQNNQVLAGNGYAQGGAIAVQNNVNAVISDSEFRGNHADGFFAQGGSIFGQYSVTLTVTDSKFDGNQATGVYSGSGGAIYLSSAGDASAGALGLIGTTFVNNQAVGGDDPLGLGMAGSATGGAVASFGVSISALDSRFNSNRAISGDGLFGGGAAFAGALYADGSSFTEPLTLSITDSKFQDNQALAGGGANGSGAASGGALVLADLATTVSDSTFQNNQATARSGGQNGSFAPGSAQGGAIWASNGALTLTDSKFNANQAIGAAGIDALSGGDGSGGALYLSTIATISDTKFDNNQAVGGNGGSQQGNGGNGSGGAIANVGSLEIKDSKFNGNRAVAGAAGSGGLDGQGLGGAIATLDFGATTITKTKLAGNKATTSGNDLFASSPS